MTYPINPLKIQNLDASAVGCHFDFFSDLERNLNLNWVPGGGVALRMEVPVAEVVGQDEHHIRLRPLI